MTERAADTPTPAITLAAQCGRALAAIHALPLERLSFLQRLALFSELRSYAGLLDGLERRHAAPACALRWVAAHLPPQWEPRVVPADFRSGNLIVGPEGLRCVLDWEIARIGDPLQDLGVLCMRTWRFGGDGLAREVGGFGAREDLYAAYEAASGTRVDPDRVRFWEVFSNLIGRRLEEPLWHLLALTTHDAGRMR